MKSFSGEAFPKEDMPRKWDSIPSFTETSPQSQVLISFLFLRFSSTPYRIVLGDGQQSLLELRQGVESPSASIIRIISRSASVQSEQSAPGAISRRSAS